MQQLDRGIFFEDSYLGVTLGALVFSHGTILIDAPLRAEDSRAWRSILASQHGGVNRILVSLDSHPDRTLGTRALDCMIIAHQKTAQVFRNRPTIFKGQTIETGAIWETFSDAIGMRWAVPDITFSDAMSLHWGGPEVILQHHPGPTSGSIWVLIPDVKVTFVGDMVVPDQPPFLAHADLDAWLEGLSVLQHSYSDFRIVSGRGGLVTAQDIEKQSLFITKVRETMEKLANEDAPTPSTAYLESSFLEHFSPPRELRDMYLKRLRYGFNHCYARRYRSINLLGQLESEEEAQ